MTIGVVIVCILACYSHDSHAKETHKNSTTLEHISAQEMYNIGQKIFHNECGGDYTKLTWWNEGEELASLGPIHAIWYPAGVKQKFKETFPELVRFIKARGKKIPTIAMHRYCPWTTRAEFMEALNSSRMKDLREFLKETFDLQIAFAIHRLKKSLPIMVRLMNKESQKNHIKQQFYRVLDSKNGIYALVDYLNFKGEGSDPGSSYSGYRWGLLQVLEGMHGTAEGAEALHDFRDSAKKVLKTRVQHAPPERNEGRWLRGWYNRVDTYV